MAAPAYRLTLAEFEQSHLHDPDEISAFSIALSRCSGNNSEPDAWLALPTVVRAEYANKVLLVPDLEPHNHHHTPVHLMCEIVLTVAVTGSVGCTYGCAP